MLSLDQKKELEHVKSLLEPDFFDKNSDKYAFKVLDVSELKSVFGDKGNFVFAKISNEVYASKAINITTSAVVDCSCKVEAIISSSDTITGPEKLLVNKRLKFQNKQL